MIALKTAFLHVKGGEHTHAMACGSELTSRLFKSSRYQENGLADGDELSFDVAFLRYMLSDGAGAALIQPAPAPNGLSLRIEWVSLTSYAHKYPPCMYIGTSDRKSARTWQDYPTFADAAADGAIALRQDMRLLPRLVKTAADEYQRLADAGMVDVDAISYAAVHYSSEALKPAAQREFARRGLDIADERWFSNLSRVGNIGCAAIYVILEELLSSNRLEPGQQILCFVPESGRFTISFALLTVVDSSDAAQ
jgi:3-oxoacyl-[acyl-carrier-protein] synthase-3